MEKTIEYRHVGGDDQRFAGLCRELDAWLLEAVGAEDLAPYEELNQAVGVEDAFLAFDGEEAVGCVCLKAYDGETAEMMRFFVREGCRGRGIARGLLETLEAFARERGYKRLILETGEMLTTAVRLYRKAGFETIQNYGPYEKMEESLCMGKSLGQNRAISG